MLNITAGGTEGIDLKCGLSGNHEFIFTMVPVAYSCNFVKGIVGNSMVVAVICHMKLKTVANIFVLNLAVSDLTFITLPMWATATATGYYLPFGNFLCKASAGLVIFNLYTSIFFLTALSILGSICGYLAIVHPMRSRMPASPVCSPGCFPDKCAHSTNSGHTQHNQVQHPTMCGILHTKDKNALILAMNLIKSILRFLVPFLIIITCYCLIGQALLNAKFIKSARSRDDEVLHMLAVAVLAFFLCWAPHQVFHFMEVLSQLGVLENCAIIKIIDTAMPFTICIGFFNSCVNPILYCFVGHNFRKNLFRLMHCAPDRVAVAHPSISSKMSTLSFGASEALSLTVTKSKVTNVK